ncbi:aldehyde dehydrogenase [Endozoicomonas sp. OPT23]|uniref:aldehyde dehydrogenase family protein n=1 Tax=Endozoicomonas sp. OPT23 TaxID=2072845 RepID=UPI00129A5F3D|nr:aldehyde dehydrogenase family protein [Endozoicomonas sp. OPT23]MRI33997.1 aldehyde dehydrogenase [Endozoicomonas sp. OPT23]
MSLYDILEEQEQSHRILKLRSPVNLEPIGTLTCANQHDVSHAVKKARKAQKDWAKLSFSQRAVYIQKALQILLDRQEEIVDTVVKETGKARTDAYNLEIFAAGDSLHYYSRKTAKILKPVKKRIHGMLGLIKQLRIVYKPLGVCGIIVPWNGPFILAINPAIQAMMAGNSVVIKSSEVTPFSTGLVEDIFREAGVPEGVCQVVQGDGQTGAYLCEAGVDKISFTGSIATGRRVAESCARQLIPCTLELGGNDAMIVCEDADLDRAASGAVIGACMNTGHFCCGTERIYVHKDVYETFLDKVKIRVKQLKQGPEHGADEDVGAVFWDRQMTIIEDHVNDAVINGAHVVCGARRNPELEGLYYEPTVLTDVRHDMKIMKEETFGPILCLQKVDSVEEAITLANDSPYGLNGNVWTKDKKKGFEIAQRIETGSMCINDMAVTYGAPEAPFGGVKSSGIGQVNGEVGLKGYCHAMPIITDRFGGKEMQSGYPYTAEKVDGLKKVMNFLWRNPIGRLFS